MAITLTPKKVLLTFGGIFVLMACFLLAYSQSASKEVSPYNGLRATVTEAPKNYMSVPVTEKFQRMAEFHKTAIESSTHTTWNEFTVVEAMEKNSEPKIYYLKIHVGNDRCIFVSFVKHSYDSFIRLQYIQLYKDIHDVLTPISSTTMNL
ncbi:hypothetical protein WA158_002688 [Blastocystis sp. Blastoise]